MSALILLVEDEKDLLATLSYSLEREGFRTRCAATAKEALARAAENPPPDLVVLDLMLPDLPGTEVCRMLRTSERTRHVPVLMLTARGEEIDRVVGFEVGADDYVVKPFSLRELALRIRAVLRRVSPQDVDAAKAFGRLRVDAGAHRCWVDESEVTLTALEFKLLATLLERRGRVQTREMLLSDVWGFSPDMTTRTVDTHVKRLRQKIGEAGRYIETLRGVGYRFRSEPDEESA
jgi:two-component system, OmpR family, phosphate regulon response regulator PhoB